MKKLYLILLIFILVPCYEVAFDASKEEELEEMLLHTHSLLPERTREDLYEELQTYLPSNKYRYESFDSLVARLGDSDDRIQDIYDTFNALKVKMHLPEEVGLYFLLGSNKNVALDIEEEALYNAYDRRLYLSDKFFQGLPSKQLCTLIHECTHIQQHQHLGLKKHIYKESFFKEQEADLNAIQAIKCPVCMQIIVDDWHDFTGNEIRRSDYGYLSQADAQRYKLEKKDSDICQAHAAHTKEAQKLRRLMPRKSQVIKSKKIVDSEKLKVEKNERCYLDLDCGKVKDRLSSVRFE